MVPKCCRRHLSIPEFTANPAARWFIGTNLKFSIFRDPFQIIQTLQYLLVQSADRHLLTTVVGTVLSGPWLGQPEAESNSHKQQHCQQLATVWGDLATHILISAAHPSMGLCPIMLNLAISRYIVYCCYLLANWWQHDILLVRLNLCQISWWSLILSYQEN